MTRWRVFRMAVTIAVLFPALSGASTRYDPRLRFRTISTARFDIHFHQGEEAQARRLARIVEEVAADVDRVLGAPNGRVQVILVNQTDLPNGWATALPYNIIEITAAGPGGESLIGNTDDWLRLVFTHEYTHVVHLGRGAGWIGGLRRVFGRMPLLYPNFFQPLWQIEGIATFEESARTGHGRLHAGDFRLIAEGVAATPGFLPLDRASGGLIRWPSGHAAYLYGGLFHEYLAGTYGEDSLKRLTDETARRLPYFGAAAYRQVFKKPLGELWAEFQTQSSKGSASLPPSSPATRLTQHGFNVSGPRFAQGNTIYYSVATPHGFPALMALTPPNGEPRRVVSKYLGSRIGVAPGAIVFDQIELVQNVGLQSDLYLLSVSTRDVRRLTSEARAADPDVSSDGQRVAFTIQRADGRGLATMPIPPDGQSSAPTMVNQDAFTDWSSPRWSRDGRFIAAERRLVGGPSEIVLVDISTGSVRRLVASNEGRNVSPAWSADNRRVLFAATGALGGFEIRSVDVESGAVLRLMDTGPNAHSPDVSPDGSTLVYVGYTPDGYDLFSLPLDSVTWAPVAPDTKVIEHGPSDLHADVTSQPYSPWGTLLPRFWTPTVESDNDELVLGAATGGYDALGRHAYAVEGGWSTSRARPDWQIAYAYDRWWPTIFANVTDDTDPFRDGTARTRELNAGAIFPVRRVRWSQTFLGGFHGSDDVLNATIEGVPRELRFDRRALRAGWLLDAARSYGYSIGEEDGWSVSAGAEVVRRALGSDGNGGSVTLDARGYVPVGARHAVLAVRGAAARTWGDETVRRAFSAAGSGPKGRDFDFGFDAIGLIRGVDESDTAGDQAFVVNVDYRVPLFRPERGIGTLPVFVRTVHAALFVDAGHAWTDAFRSSDITRAIGAELSLDSVLGHAVPVTVTGGVAWRRVVDRSGAVVFARVGRAF